MPVSAAAGRYDGALWKVTTTAKPYTAMMRGGLLSRERDKAQGPRLLTPAEGNMSSTEIARCCRSAVVEDPITHQRIASESGRSRVWPDGLGRRGPRREGDEL